MGNNGQEIDTLPLTGQSIDKKDRIDVRYAFMKIYLVCGLEFKGQ